MCKSSPLSFASMYILPASWVRTTGPLFNRNLPTSNTAFMCSAFAVTLSCTSLKASSRLRILSFNVPVTVLRSRQTFLLTGFCERRNERATLTLQVVLDVHTNSLVLQEMAGGCYWHWSQLVKLGGGKAWIHRKPE